MVDLPLTPLHLQIVKPAMFRTLESKNMPRRVVENNEMNGHRKFEMINSMPLF
jgi:hypothetical protein